MHIVDDVKRLLDDYWRWLRDNTVLKADGNDWAVITTPFLDRHNDFLEIYVRRDGNGFLLTDTGAVIRDLDMSGCPVIRTRREKLLRTVRGFGVALDDDALCVHCTSQDFGQKKHALVQAMLSVDDLFYTVDAPKGARIFSTEVSDWLTSKRIRNTPEVSFPSRSGFTYKMDFVIPAFDDAPERILKVYNSVNTTNARMAILAKYETEDSRPHESRYYAVMNDSKGIGSEVTTALNNCHITVLPWSRRDDFIEELSA